MLSAEEEITVMELKELIGMGTEHIVVDIREPHELQISKLDNTLDIPLSQISTQVHRIPRDKLVVLLCRAGNRSGRLLVAMRRIGYKNLKNLVGGINDWARYIDPTMRVY